MNNPGQNWVGQTLGNRYKIEAVLGRGGMSSVYRAHDPNLNRKVAIKIIHQNLTDNAEFIHRFEQEAALIAQLRHPNIVQVHDFNHDNNTYYMVMEYIPGETLSHRLEALKNAGIRLPLADTVRILSKICSAVDYAHQRRMIHRDLKPANVMLDLLGEPFLMDFGIARLVGVRPSLASAVPMGTAAYMAPEQVRGEEGDHRADIYALGIMLYEMLSGNLPFQDDSTYQVMVKQVNEPPPDIQAVEINTPQSLIVILERALVKDPNGRFQTAAEMNLALYAAGGQLQGTADTPVTRQLDQQALLWQQARDLFEDRQWLACLEKLAELRRTDPDYQPHKVGGLQRDALDQLNKQGEREFAAGQFAETLAAVEAIRRYDPSYPVNELEFKAHLGIQQAELRTQLDGLYDEAAVLLERREYEQALAKWRSIQVQKENLDYPDRLLLEKRAKEGACAMLYTAALAALAEHQPDIALAKMAHIYEIEPQFPDSQQVKAKALEMQNGQSLPRSRRRLAWAGGALFLFLLLLAGVLLPGRLRGETAATPTTLAVLLPTRTQTAVPTATASPTPKPTASQTPTRTPLATPSPVPTETATPQATFQASVRAVALENVSLFPAPDATTEELAILEAGQEVWVLGRSETGNWLYVSTDAGERGFASVARFNWVGDMNWLPVRRPFVVNATPTAALTPSSEQLLFDFYQLDGTQQCNGEAWTIYLFMQGRGGNGIYSYYWNDELLAANQSGSHTFPVNSGGGPITGIGRVTSGNLTAEKELFLTKSICN
jgi:hypothetical protein